MAQFPKPDGLNIQWASAGDILDPGDTKYQTGWGVEIPPRQWENYIQNKQDNFIAHANQHGICVWDAATEYQWTVGGAKSLVMGSDGAIYRTLTTNINQDPTLTAGTHWEIAFSNAGDFYTKVEADALYLAKAQNLADLTNFTTARTNLSVYSQAQTYTKTEVDAITTVASTAQSQAWTSNTTLITPLRLAEAFKGSNQSLTANGFQEIPGGYVIQHGAANVAADTGSINFPQPFPNACFGVFITDLTTSPASVVSFGTNTPTATGFTWYATTTAGGFSWFAVGF